FDALPFAVKLINNTSPKGFAENHNSAFSVSVGDNFVILNPDVTILDDPFDILLSLIEREPNSICAPLILNRDSKVEDSARNFPSPLFLLKKLFSRIFHFSLAPEIVAAKDDVIMPDWVAGMFVVVPREIYTTLRGLNE